MTQILRRAWSMALVSSLALAASASGMGEPANSAGFLAPGNTGPEKGVDVEWYSGRFHRWHQTTTITAIPADATSVLYNDGGNNTGVGVGERRSGQGQGN